MCGRATLTVDVEEIAEVIGALPLEGERPATRKGWNLAPTDPMIIVRPLVGTSSPSLREPPPLPIVHRPRAAPSAHALRAGHATDREMAIARWGLIPWWAKKDEAKRLGSRFVQARVETLAKTPAFRDAFKRHRCLVIVDGFYEWKTAPDGNRMPHHVHREDRKPFAIAGVWDSWTSPDTGEIIESCAVVTTEAEGHIADLHDRMPLVIGKDAYDAWLKGTTEEASKVTAVTPDLVTMAVSKYVNDVRHDDEQCIRPL